MFLIEEYIVRNLCIMCGGRHGQNHSGYLSGLQEFWSGALVDANSRAGRMPGDPDAEFRQPHVMRKALGGILQVRLGPGTEPRAYFKVSD